MNLKEFLDTLNKRASSINFSDTMAVIDEHYLFTESAFTNGEVKNLAGQNNGSCKIFAFALLNNLTQHQTLECFGDYYRIDVLQNPQGKDHQNIRNFIEHGWEGIHFEGTALAAK